MADQAEQRLRIPGTLTASLARVPGLSPAAVAGLFLVGYLGIILARAGGDPLTFVRVGEGFREGQPLGSDLGYDGQYSYFIALDPRPAFVAERLDVPAYRYQRILYPMLARGLALGQRGAIPWTLLAVNLAAQIAGTHLVARWLVERGASRWYALPYGLWAGLVLAARLDLTEPLCYALVAASMLAHQRGRYGWAGAWMALALFTKEAALLFLAAQVVWAIVARHLRALAMCVAALGLYAIFQWLLFVWFGVPGLTSGGFLATPFEWIPFMGLWRIGGVSLAALALFGFIYLPLVVAPSVWGIAASANRLWQRDLALPVFALGANAGFLPFTPFSTFREPLGLVRLAAGLVLATLLFGAHIRSRRVLNYSLLWIAALAFLRE